LKLVKEIESRVLLPILGCDFNVKVFLTYLANAISGCNIRKKKIMVILGGRDSGKSLLYKLIHKCFKAIVCNFNSSEFLTGFLGNGLDADLKLKFCFDFDKVRLATSSELHVGPFHK
jgi:hypothetical protein